jgi:VIT1/CCC1 family predicted Fe2+/Mn2+ transporter
MSSLDSWSQEKQSAYLYRVLAHAEPSPTRRTLFHNLAREADEQAEIWADQVRSSGRPVPSEYIPSARVRLVERLIRWFGPSRLRLILSAMKVRGMSLYGQPSLHFGHAMPRSVADVGSRHQHGGAGANLRAAVFGVNDGLVSNASLILGIAGATEHGGVIVLSGAAGLVAGALSMAAGEYISVRSQREMFEKQIAAERDELAQYPAEEAAELALIYEARGLPKQDALNVATRLIADPKHALDTLAREELGLNPDELGSPWRAAISSFLAFAAGALVPLLPFVFVSGRWALVTAILLTAASLFGVGASISLFTGRTAWVGGIRMLLIGGSAGAATFLIGRLLGVNIS